MIFFSIQPQCSWIIFSVLTLLFVLFQFGIELLENGESSKHLCRSYCSGLGFGVCSTYFVHRGTEWQKALFDEVIHGLVVVCSYLRHHVTGYQPHPAFHFSSVKPIQVLITVHLAVVKTKTLNLSLVVRDRIQYKCESSHLNDLPLFEWKLLISCVRIGGHGQRIVVEEGHKNPKVLLRF